MDTPKAHRLKAFTSMVKNFSSALPSESFDYLKCYCEIMGVMASGQLKGMATPSQLLGWLRTKRLLNPDNLQLLYYLAAHSRQAELQQVIDDFSLTRTAEVDADPKKAEHPDHEPDVLNYSSVAFSLSLRPNSLKRSQVDDLCRRICEAVDISFHEMAWEGLAMGDTASTTVLMTLMPMKALISIKEMTQAAKAQLQIVDVNILGLKADDFEAILQPIRRGSGMSTQAAGSVSPALWRIFFWEAAKCDNANALKTLYDVQQSLNIRVDLQVAVQVAVKAGSIKAVRYLVLQEAPLSTKVLYDAYLFGHEEIVKELRNKETSLRLDLSSCNELIAEASSRADYSASLYESLLATSPVDSDGSIYGKAVVNCCRNGRPDLVTMLILKGAKVRPLPEDCFQCFGEGLANIRCKSYRANQRGNQWIVGCDIDWKECKLFLIDGSWFQHIEKEKDVLLTRVDVSGNHLQSLPLNLLDGTFPFLEELFCSGNKIISLGNDEVFSVTSAATPRLKTVDVSHNNLKSIPLFLFRMKSLENLNLSYNSLQALPLENWSTTGEDELVWRCTHLSTLDISHNSFEMLPEWFGHALNLRRLKAASNKLITLPKSFAKMKILNFLDLSENRLGQDVKEKEELGFIPKSVTNLIVRKNALMSLPNAFLQISSLKELDCSENEIRSLPSLSSWNVPFLESLNLSGNKLQTVDFPSSLSSSLRQLDLSFNGLNGFPEAVIKLSLLSLLNLKGNPTIKSYPEKLAKLKLLWDVELDNSVEAFLALDPTGGRMSIDGVHYSKVREKIREKFYNIDYFNGAKMTIIGNKSSRDDIFWRLHKKSGTTSMLAVKDRFPVTSLVLSERSERLPPDTDIQPSRQRSRSFMARLRKERQCSTTAAFKVWEIADTHSFLALQNVFFNENTIHLVLCDLADGVEGVEKWLQLIQTKSSTVCALVASLGHIDNSFQASESQDRLRKLLQLPKYSKWCRYINVDRRNPFCLPSELVGEAARLARESQTGQQENKVPLYSREIALELIKAANFKELSMVCRRENLDFISKLNKEEIDEDEFSQTAHFLTRVGALVHFNDTPGSLYQFFFPNLSSLTQIIQILSCRGNSRFARACVVSETYFRYLFTDFDVFKSTDLKAILTLLKKLQIIVPVNKDYLLPFRLPMERPGFNLSISQFMPFKTDGNLPCVRRIYSTEQLPPGFWSRMISFFVQEMPRLSRTLTSSDGITAISPHSVYWQDGLALFYPTGCCIVEAIVPDDDGDNDSHESGDKEKFAGRWYRNQKQLLDAQAITLTKWGLDISVFDSSRRYSAFGFACDRVEMFLNERQLEVRNRFIPYPPFCLETECGTSDSALSDFIANHWVPSEAQRYNLSELALTFSKQATGNNWGQTMTLPEVFQQVPDIAIIELPDHFRLDEDKLEIYLSSCVNSNIDGFGHDLAGVYDQEDVSLKVFGSLKFMDTSDAKMSLSAKRKSMHPWKSFEAIIKSSHSAEDYCSWLMPFRREVLSCQLLQHPNIVLLKGVLFNPFPCIITEAAPGGDLETLISDRLKEFCGVGDDANAEVDFDKLHHGVLGRKLTQRIAYQIALALEYLHGQSICHLNVNPKDILVWSDSPTARVNVKLSGYGASVTSQPQMAIQGPGKTLRYQAPEQILSANSSNRSFDVRADIYSYGIVLYQVLTGISPYGTNIWPSIIEFKIRHNQLPKLPNGQSMIYLQGLISRCWKYWPNERPSAIEIVAEMSEPTFHLCCKDLLCIPKLSTFSLFTTSPESLLEGDLYYSSFLSNQNICSSLPVEKVTALLLQRDRLWVGLSSGEIRVFECSKGIIMRELAGNTFKSTFPVVDLKAQNVNCEKSAKVFALFADEEIVTFEGEKSSGAKPGRWIGDSDRTWDSLRRLRLRPITDFDNFGKKESAPAFLLPVLPNNIWFVSGNGIFVIDTGGKEETVVVVDGSDPRGKIVVEGIQRIKECAVVADVVWMCDEMEKEWLVKVNVATRQTMGRWSIKDLFQAYRSFDASASICKRSDTQEKLLQCQLSAVSCICAVNGSLWVGCEGGGIVILEVGEGRDTPAVVSILWCRAVWSYAINTGNKRPVTVDKLQHVGKRVLAFCSDCEMACDEKTDPIHTVAEIFEACSIDELKESMKYYNIHRP
eukprot:m.186686 g.186686  ORF g.186686 m.186686 type:complete len:2135 (+) comp39354_c0_seq50:173-6577(+)